METNGIREEYIFAEEWSGEGNLYGFMEGKNLYALCNQIRIRRPDALLFKGVPSRVIKALWVKSWEPEASC